MDQRLRDILQQQKSDMGFKMYSFEAEFDMEINLAF